MPQNTPDRRLAPPVLLVLLGLWLGVTSALAQRPELTFFAGPSIAYRTLSAQGNHSYLAGAFDDTDRRAVLGEVGLRHSQAVGKRSRLSGGLTYGTLGYNFSEAPLKWGSQWNGTAFDPTLPSGEPDASPLIGHRFTYVAAPIEYAYQLLGDGHSVRLSLRGGAEPAILVGQVQRLRASDNSRYSRELDGLFHGYSLGLRTGLSVSYGMAPGWAIVAEPTFRHQLLPLIEGLLQTRLYSTSLMLGIQRTL